MQRLGGRMRWRMLALHGDVHRIGRIGAGIFSVLSFIAAVLSTVTMVVYVGFDHTVLNHDHLLKILHVSIFIYTADIIFRGIFRDDSSVGGRTLRIIKWIGDTAILLAFIPILFPDLGRTVVVLRIFSGSWYFFITLGLYSLAELSRGLMWALSRRTNPSLILSGSFLFFILAGSLVLMLPRCSTSGLHFSDALFIASSAVSMTGLSSVDVPTALTPLGWVVLAVLMQIGALGVLTFTSFFSLFFTGRTSIYNQLLIKDFIYSKSMTALVPVMIYILGFTLTVEAIGAIGVFFTIDPVWMPSISDRIGTAAFHSIAAFTNSGFSTLPDGLANPALFNGNQLIYIVLTVLILAGGIGFPNLVNFKEVLKEHLLRLRSRLSGRRMPQRRLHVYDLNTKLVLVSTGILFLGGAIAFFLLEGNHSMSGFPLGKKIIQSVFASATARSAGFAPISPAQFLNVTMLVMMVLMWIGGASQSMAGGVKVNTVSVALLSLRSLLHGHKGVTVFGRRIASSSVQRAYGVIFTSIIVLIAVSVTVILLEPAFSTRDILFECLSAVCTNGLSTGITPELSDGSKFLLALMMFLGRVGVMSVLMGLMPETADLSDHLPQEDVVIN